MKAITIELDDFVFKQLSDISQEKGTSIKQVIQEILIDYHKKLFWEKCKLAAQRLKENDELWQEELEERKLFDNTLLDGLEDDISYC